MATDSTASCFLSDEGEAVSLYFAEILKRLPAGAQLASRGCGDPVAQAHVRPGERVLDLGSGGGIDALIAAQMTGPKGKVYGLDLSSEMVALAQENARSARIGNVEFLEGDVQSIPLPDAFVDLVISNCVVNLCESKHAVFSEAQRVLAPGGRLVISDIVALSEIPAEAEDDLCALTGCRNGITSSDEYERDLRACGFSRVEISPKTIYTLEVLEKKARRRGRLPLFERAARFPIDAVTGSVIIRAWTECDEANPRGAA